MKDLRIYYYEGGQLLKIDKGNRLHKARTEEEAKNNVIRWIRKNKYTKRNQFVIIEIFSNYNSKIIDVIEPVIK